MDERSRRKATSPTVALILLTCIYAANLLDRQILSLLAEPIKQELNLSDTQIGLLSGVVFALFYATLGLPIAALSDRHNRIKIVAACCATWSLFTAACGLASTFLQLATARVGVATGEAGAVPASHSIIADYFPSGRRAMALSIFSLGAPIGTFAGGLIAGTVGASMGWRTAFLMASIPGVLLVIGLLFFVRNPQRGRLDSEAAKVAAPVAFTTFVARFAATPVLLRTTIAGACAAFAYYSTAVWLPPYLMRELGMSLREIGLYYGTAIGLAMIASQLLGGISDRLARRWPTAPAIVSAASFVVASLFFLAGLMAPTWYIALPLFIVSSAAGVLYIGPSNALIQDTAAPSQRSLASATFLLTLNLFGLGIGPVFVGLISDATAAHPQGGLWAGLLALAPFYLLAALAFCWTAVAMRPVPNASQA